jgi:hypothetical protein
MRKLILTALLAACSEGRATTPPPAEEPERAAEPDPPAPVYTSAVCCVTGHTCALDDALPLGTTCACPTPEGDLQGHVC